MGIWEDESTTKDVPQENLVEESKEEKVEKKQDGFAGLPVRTEGDRIWLLKDGKRYWVTSADAYTKLGFKFGDEREIDETTLKTLPEGEPLK